LVVDRGDRAPAHRRIAGELIVGAVADFECGIDDRPVAGAAAQIARQRIVDPVAGRGTAAFVVMREQAHHNTRRTEAALRAVVARHGFLDRVQHAVVLKIFDRDQFGAVELAEQGDARIDGLIDQAPVTLARHHDRTGATIALRAAFFGADRAFFQPQPVEHGGARGKFVDPHCPAAALKLQNVSGHGSGLGALCLGISWRIIAICA